MKYSVYILVVLVLHTIFSCTHKFDEYNDNPNDMDMGTIHPLSLLQEIVFSGCDGMLYRTWLLNGELIQYTVSATTTNAYHRYIIQNGVMASCWNHLAQWAANADHMRELAEEQNDDNSQAIALTMRALYVSNLTDMFGDIPFSEVFQGRTGNTIPAFDTQKEVYEQLFKDLELANSLYNSAGLTHPTKDILFNGDVKKWQKFTNSLYMRLLMRVSGRSEMNVGEKLTEIINSPDVYPIFSSNDDNAVLYFTGIAPNENRFGSSSTSSFTSIGRKMCKTLVTIMDTVGDPRLPIYGVQRGSQWDGTESGLPTQETDADASAYLNQDVLGDYTSPYAIMKYDEVLFILSEAAFKGLIPGGEAIAQDYYERAVEASIRYWDEVNPSETYQVSDEVINQFIGKVAWNNTYEQIMLQKYVALFWVGYEAWHEYRRTELPELPIGSGTDNDHILPRRFQYPVNTATTNPDNYQKVVNRLKNNYGGDDDMKAPVWWSKNGIERYR